MSIHRSPLRSSIALLSAVLFATAPLFAENGPAGVPLPPKGPEVSVSAARQKLRDNMEQQIAEFMRLHNDARAEVGVPPLVWDEGIAAYAQEWADKIAAKDQMDHRPNGKYGENIAGYLPQYGERPVHGAKMWYDEIKDYHGEKIDERNFMKFGHYTQMVWRTSARVGFGVAMTKKGTVMLVANYSPAGNMVGEHPYRVEGGAVAAVPPGVMPAAPAGGVAVGGKPRTDKYGNVIPDGPPPAGLEKPIDMPAEGAPGAAVAGNQAPAADTFIATLNELRKKRGLPAMKLDAQIVQSAQWLAEHMARYDKMDHDAVVIGGKQFANMRGIGERLKSVGFASAGAAEACAEGEYADISTATREFTLGWANGKTHYRPFLSKDGQVFETCGFGLARSKKNPRKFYACALFANRDGEAPAGVVVAGGGGGAAPMPKGNGDAVDQVVNKAVGALAALLDGGKPAAAGQAVGGIALKYAPGWKTVSKDGNITSVSPDGSARVVVALVKGPKDAPDGPWDAIQAGMGRYLAPHFPGLADLAEVDTQHDVMRDGVGLRLVTYTARFQDKPVDLVVDFARENNRDSDRLVLVIRCSEQGDTKNQTAARKVAESLKLKK